jgi:hypothetical protein
MGALMAHDEAVAAGVKLEQGSMPPVASKVLTPEGRKVG